MNINKIVNDSELWEEYRKARAIAAPYRSKLQFKLAILTMPDTHICDEFVYNTAMGIPLTLIFAPTGYICDDLKG